MPAKYGIYSIVTGVRRDPGDLRDPGGSIPPARAVHSEQVPACRPVGSSVVGEICTARTHQGITPGFLK